jgi:hypothetical protein
MAVPGLAEFVSCFSLEIDAEIVRKWLGMSVPVLAKLGSNVLVKILAESVIYFFVLLARQLAVVGPAVPGRGGPARTLRPARPDRPGPP